MALFSPSRAIRLGKFMNTKSSILKIASTKLSTCQETDTLEKLLPVLANKYRRLPVTGKKDKSFRGFVTSIDLLDYLGAGHKRWIFKKNRGSLKTTAKSIMETQVLELDKNLSIKKALEAFQEHRRGASPVTYRGTLVGIVSEWDFIRHIDSPLKIRAEELMVKKPMILKDNFTLLDAAKIMVRSGFRRLPVAKDNILLGIATPSDILTFLRKRKLLSRLERDKTRITSAMNRNVTTISPEDDVSKAVKIMAKRRIGGLPVTEDSELLGILTERDILDALA